MTRLGLLLTLLALPVLGQDVGDTAADTAAAPAVVDYDIRVRLDPALKMLYGQETIVYRNLTPDIISDLRFHLYLNAFKNQHSTYWLESVERPSGDAFGYCQIRRASATIDGVDQTGLSDYWIGEDGDRGDQTVWRMELMGPLLPGQSVTVQIDFESRLPRSFDRTGYRDDFFTVAQWFPKLGVWESRGVRGAAESGWNCRHFHHDTEFYANFGRYRVEITLPAGYIAGATGKLVSQREGSGSLTQTYEQDRVHDFAFVAGRDLERHTRTFAPDQWVSEDELAAVMALHGISREEARLTPVEMILLIQKRHRGQVERHFAALGVAIKEMGLRLGRYPYETITIVDPPPGLSGMGGMEYPTLIMLGTQAGAAVRDYDLEDLIIHEYGHQYFYGLIGSNEFEESWLDEGLTSFVEAEVLDATFGKLGGYLYPFDQPLALTDKLGIQRWDLVEFSKNRVAGEGVRDPIVKPGWAYFSHSNYGINSYRKPTLALAQLKAELGADVMARCLRAFVQRWSFGHPATADFIAVVEEVSGRDLGWFFDEVFYKAGFLDYEVLPVVTAVTDNSAGYRDGPDGPVFHRAKTRVEVGPGEKGAPGKAAADATGIEAESGADSPSAAAEVGQGTRPVAATISGRQFVKIHNRGNLSYPVDVRVVFEDGDEVVEHWDGRGAWVGFHYDDRPSIRRVDLDPEGKLVLDLCAANNSYRAKPDSRAAKRWSAWVLTLFQQGLQSLAGGL